MQIMRYKVAKLEIVPFQIANLPEEEFFLGKLVVIFFQL